MKLLVIYHQLNTEAKIGLEMRKLETREKMNQKSGWKLIGPTEDRSIMICRFLNNPDRNSWRHRLQMLRNWNWFRIAAPLLKIVLQANIPWCTKSRQRKLYQLPPVFWKLVLLEPVALMVHHQLKSRVIWISRERPKVTVNITIRLIETENQGGYENNCKLSRNWNIFHFFGIFLR